MLYLHATHQRAHLLGASLHDPVPPTEHHWLDHWHVNLLDLKNHFARVFVLMNVQTRFIMLFMDRESRTLEEILPVFIERLDRFTGYSLSERYQDHKVCENSSAFDLGIMNELTYKIMRYEERMQKMDTDRIETIWNQTTIHQKVPFDTLMGLLQDGVDQPFEDTAVPFLKIVK